MGAIAFVIGKIAFAAIGVAVGWQLAAEVRRGESPGPHRVALAALSVGGLGLVAMPLADALGSEALSLGGEVAVRIALLLLCLFIARTFRPGALGLAGAAACGLLLLATLAWDVAAQPALTRYDYARPSSHASQLSAAIPFAWSALESGVLWRRARRRLRIGLGEPVLAERFLLWSLATACFVAISLLAIAAGEAEAAGLAERADRIHGVRGLLYLTISGLVWRARFRGPEQRQETSDARPAA